MSQSNRPLEPWERKALRDYIHDTIGKRRSSSDDIIKLAMEAVAVSASRALSACVRRPDIVITKTASHTTPAFEHRLVALFSE